MNRRFFIALFVLVLSACATSPKKIHYYQLSSTNSLPVTKQSNEQDLSSKSALVVLQPLGLASYLRRQGIVMETSAHQLQISSRHQWAEGLQNAITRLVLNGLSVQLSNFRFENNDRLNGGEANYQLKISLEQFHIGRDSQTITSGHFWLFDQQQKLIVKKAFSLNRTLRKDGYEQAVDQLEKSLQELVKMIADEVEKLGV